MKSARRRSNDGSTADVRSNGISDSLPAADQAGQIQARELRAERGRLNLADGLVVRRREQRRVRWRFRCDRRNPPGRCRAGLIRFFHSFMGVIQPLAVGLWLLPMGFKIIARDGLPVFAIGEPPRRNPICQSGHEQAGQQQDGHEDRHEHDQGEQGFKQDFHGVVFWFAGIPA